MRERSRTREHSAKSWCAFDHILTLESSSFQIATRATWFLYRESRNITGYIPTEEADISLFSFSPIITWYDDYMLGIQAKTPSRFISKISCPSGLFINKHGKVASVHKNIHLRPISFFILPKVQWKHVNRQDSMLFLPTLDNLKQEIS